MRWFTRFLGERLAWLFAVAVAITVYEVVARYVFNAPTIWAHESTILICSVAFAIGGAYVQERDEHIRVTVLTERFGGRTGTALDVFGRLLGIVFLGGVLWGGHRDAWEALSNWQTTQTAFDSPMPAIVKPAVMLAAAMMVVLLAMDIVRVLCRGEGR